MRIKLDECVDARVAVLLRQAGHEVTTVRDQGLQGIENHDLHRHYRSKEHV